LQYNRIELKATRNELIEQNKTFRLQRFENTFFNLIEVHQGILRDLRREIYDQGKSKIYQGRDLFAKIRNWHKRLYDVIQKIHREKRFNETHSGDFQILLNTRNIGQENILKQIEEKGSSEKTVIDIT
jgi:hypothetical protein